MCKVPAIAQWVKEQARAWASAITVAADGQRGQSAQEVAAEEASEEDQLSIVRQHIQQESESEGGLRVSGGHAAGSPSSSRALHAADATAADAPAGGADVPAVRPEPAVSARGEEEADLHDLSAHGGRTRGKRHADGPRDRRISSSWGATPWIA